MASIHSSVSPPRRGASLPRDLPKVLLHEHLDGGLRPQTLFDLCRARGIAVPAKDAAGLAAWMHANADSGSLESYLLGFDLTVNAMASTEACERVAFEAAEDALEDGCVLAEFRMAPQLLERHGLRPEEVIEAILRGLRRSRLACGLIVCGMRTDPPEVTRRAAELAARYRDAGVVGFDLAGAERGFPPGAHREALRVAAEAGVGITCHAGESDEGSRVLEAAQLGARRIGHGIHIVNGHDPAETARWIAEARDRGLHFEVCPSSNVHTGAVSSLAEHPIARMQQAGLSVSCSTDNRLMSAVTLSGELQRLHDALDLGISELGAMMMNAAEASFLPVADRERAKQQIRAAWRE
jgi:adenosine deaminase